MVSLQCRNQEADKSIKRTKTEKCIHIPFVRFIKPYTHGLIIVELGACMIYPPKMDVDTPLIMFA